MFARRSTPAQVMEPAASVHTRQRLTVTGVVRSTMVRTNVGTGVEFVAEIRHAQGALSVVWFGRDRVLGLEQGQNVRVSGVVSERLGRRLMYNPSYELMSGTSQAPTFAVPARAGESQGRSEGRRL